MKTDIAGSSRVRVWLELGGSGGTGSVEVGQATTLGVRAILPGSVGVRVVDCIALDGLGEASQKLLDERGCPIDEQVSSPKRGEFHFFLRRMKSQRKSQKFALQTF